MKSSRLSWGNTLEVVQRINVYATSVLTFSMRADIDVDEIAEEYERLVRSVLRRRINWKRLTATLASGGYGVVDIVKRDRAIKRTWLSYLSERRNRGVFERIMRWWSNGVKEKAHTCVGPLNAYHGMSGETKVWRFLARAWEGVERWCYWDKLTNLYEWTDKDRLGEKIKVVGVVGNMYEGEKMMYRWCDVVDPEIDDMDMVRNVVRFWEVGGKRVATKAQGRGGWMKVEKEETVDTPSQKRWLENGFDWRERWKEVRKNKRLPSRIKSWVLDALNNALRARYHSADAVCQLCGEEVDGRHYTGGWGAMERVRKEAKCRGVELQEEELWWVTWIKATSGKEQKVIEKRLKGYRRTL